MIENFTLIFDIGKTNKKLYLIDESLKERYQEYKRFEELKDDDGFPCDDLEGIAKWILDSIHRLIDEGEYKISKINFSTYGASLVHLDANGNRVTPFYNYLKPFPDDLKKAFFKKYYGEGNFTLVTASPSMGFLNSGFQLYYLKNKKPSFFKKLHRTLHFPQYLTYLITRKYSAEYTSVGCHTGLWDYINNEYAEWVKEEGLLELLPPVVNTSDFFTVEIEGLEIEVGVGVHDSSAALIPYLELSENPFILLSTGTWNICLNPFNNSQLNKDDLSKDCLMFMTKDGHSVKASRLFLGQELREKAMDLGAHFKEVYHKYKSITYNSAFKAKNECKKLLFHYKHLNEEGFGFSKPEKDRLDLFDSFEEAYHQLMHELTDIQISAIKLAVGSTKIHEIYIDGGFAHNEIFTQMLANKLPDMQVQSTEIALGSSLGAALLVADQSAKAHLKDSYKTRIHCPEHD